MKRVLLGLALCACNASAPAPAKDTAPTATATAQAAPAPAAQAPKHFGAAFTLAASEPLSHAIAKCDAPDAGQKPAESCGAVNGDEGGGKKVRVRGTVTSVCQKMGCWMMLADGASEARIFTREHGFFLPKDIAGKTAEAEGVLQARKLSPAFAKHLADDAGKEAPKDGKADAGSAYVMSAAAVDVVD